MTATLNAVAVMAMRIINREKVRSRLKAMRPAIKKGSLKINSGFGIISNWNQTYGFLGKQGRDTMNNEVIINFVKENILISWLFLRHDITKILFFKLVLRDDC